MDSAKLQETRRAARGWGESFKIGDRVEVKIGKVWVPMAIDAILREKGWPIIQLILPSSRHYLVWYRERKTIRKVEG